MTDTSKLQRFMDVLTELHTYQLVAYKFGGKLAPDDAIAAERLLEEFQSLAAELDGTPDAGMAQHLIEVSERLTEATRGLLDSMVITSDDESEVFKVKARVAEILRRARRADRDAEPSN